MHLAAGWLAGWLLAGFYICTDLVFSDGRRPGLAARILHGLLARLILWVFVDPGGIRSRRNERVHVE